MPVGFDKVTICNMALAHIGSNMTIESIDERNPAAKNCKLWYDAARLRTLEDFNWSFARKSLPMATHSVDAPTNRWSFRYQYPSDCVAPRLIENPAGPFEDPIPYEVENAGDSTLSILTDLDEAVLLYTFNLETVSLFSTHFTETLSLALASRIGYKLSGKTSLVKQVTNAYAAKIIEAQIVDNNSVMPRDVRDAVTIRARM